MKRLMVGCLFLGVAACGDAPTTQDELQALLNDEPLSGFGGGVGVRSSGLTVDGGPGPIEPGDGGIIIPDDGGGGGGSGDSGGIPPRPDAGIDPIDALPDFDASPGDIFTGDAGGPIGFGVLGDWQFDDCNDVRTNLVDQSFNNNTAFRSVSVTCAPGISGQAVALADRNEDIILVPDQPNFTFGGGVTVAAWINPASANQTSSLIRKRSDGSSSFALLLHNGRYRFVVNLGRGRAADVTSRSRAAVGQWAHVAATYDGSALRIYVNGQEERHQNISGVIETVGGPLLLGNDGTRRLFPGAIDNAFFEARALAAAEIAQLTCIRGQVTVSATPPTSAPTLPGVTATYDIAVTNNDSPSCAPSDFVFVNNNFTPGIIALPDFEVLSAVPAGATAHLTLSVTATDDPEPGTHIIPFTIFGARRDVSAFGSVEFVLASSGCRISSARELMIRDVSVVDDPIRTNNFGDPNDPRTGVWTLRHLAETMAPTPADAPAMIEAMLSSFNTPQSVNGFSIAPRPGMQRLILENWPRVNGQLDLSQAPVRLQAIVNRIDLTNLAQGDAGEGRFVFAFNGPDGFFPLQATIIFEYKLPASTPDEALAWANAWHALSSLPFPSEEYNAALQNITEGFAGRNVRPTHVNGSAINAVRTNEIDLGDNGIWELREFVLSSVNGMLIPGTIALTPDLSFNFSQTLANWINQNEAAILSETHQVPMQFEGAPFAVGAVFNDLSTWIVPGVNNPEARHRFALNTCNGCHSLQETNTFFLQIIPRFPGSEAGLSGFLTGTTVADPVTGEPRTFNDLARRAAFLRAIVCP